MLLATSCDLYFYAANSFCEAARPRVFPEFNSTIDKITTASTNTTTTSTTLIETKNVQSAYTVASTLISRYVACGGRLLSFPVHCFCVSFSFFCFVVYWMHTAWIWLHTCGTDCILQITWIAVKHDDSYRERRGGGEKGKSKTACKRRLDFALSIPEVFPSLIFFHIFLRK